MKKNILVLALAAGFSCVAQAETSVTLYGIIDTGVGYQSQKSTATVVDYDPGSGKSVYSTDTIKRSKTGVINGVQNGSRWGLKGSEDLGGGLSAVFVLENGFDSSTGDAAQGGRLFGRQATVGLHGDSFGRLDFGRQWNVGSWYMPGIIDPFRGGFGQANAGAALGATNAVRYDNMIMYQTPNFSGFQFGIGYSFNTNGSQSFTYNSQNNNIRAITSGLRYVKGPIGVGLTYDQKMSADNSSAADTTARQWNLGVAYDFGVAKVSLAFGQTRNGNFGGSYGWGGSVVRSPAMQDYYNTLNPNDPGDKVKIAAMNSAAAAAPVFGVNEFDRGFKSNSFVVGLSAPIGAGTILASWQLVDPRSKPDRFASSNWDLKKQNTYSLGYTYSLSKRTNIYVYGSYAKNQDFIEDHQTIIGGVGVRHRF